MTTSEIIVQLSELVSGNIKEWCELIEKKYYEKSFELVNNIINEVIYSQSLEIFCEI
jgi:hypothetical protein